MFDQLRFLSIFADYHDHHTIHSYYHHHHTTQSYHQNNHKKTWSRFLMSSAFFRSLPTIGISSSWSWSYYRSILSILIMINWSSYKTWSRFLISSAFLRSLPTIGICERRCEINRACTWYNHHHDDHGEDYHADHGGIIMMVMVMFNVAVCVFAMMSVCLCGHLI